MSRDLSDICRMYFNKSEELAKKLNIRYSDYNKIISYNPSATGTYSYVVESNNDLLIYNFKGINPYNPTIILLHQAAYYISRLGEIL